MGRKINSIPKGIRSNLFFESDEDAIRVLKAEAKILKSIAITEWRRYINSYTPSVYVRSGDSEKSIKVGDVKKIGYNEWGISVYFDNDLAYHDSVVGKNQPQGHAIMLISTGWKARQLEKRIGIRQNFTRHKGTGYLYKVSEKYNSVKHRGISLEIQWKQK